VGGHPGLARGDFDASARFARSAEDGIRVGTQLLHSINLALRFLLELSALVAVGVFGWHTLAAHGAVTWLAAVGFPLIFATVWGVFAVPEDPSRSGNAPVPVPGWARLVLELALFSAASGALLLAGHPTLAAWLAGAVLLHYSLSWDRIRWLMAR
jgi:hypothetical protein